MDSEWSGSESNEESEPSARGQNNDDNEKSQEIATRNRAGTGQDSLKPKKDKKKRTKEEKKARKEKKAKKKAKKEAEEKAKQIPGPYDAQGKLKRNR